MAYTTITEQEFKDKQKEAARLILEARKVIIEMVQHPEFKEHQEWYRKKITHSIHDLFQLSTEL